MQCAVFNFRIRTGLGTQTVSGIVDKDGNAFTPEYLWFINGSSELNLLWSNGSGVYNTTTYCENLYRASDGAAGYGATGILPQFGVKIGSGGGGSGPNCALVSLEADAFFGGNNYRYCRINSVSSGSFELEVMHTEAWAFTTDVMCLALANAGDLSMSTPAFLDVAGFHSTTGIPRAIIRGLCASVATSGSPATGAGGSAFGWGWDTPNGGPFTAKTRNTAQAGGVNTRYQISTRYGADLDNAGTKTDGAYVSVWASNGITSAGANGGPGTPVLVTGDSVVAASGKFVQPSSTGHQTITTGINAAWVCVASVGLPTSTSVDTTWSEMAVGWTNGTSQMHYWGGEKALTLPLLGANIVSDTHLLRFADATGPNGSSTAFGAYCSIVEIDSTGSFTVNWSLVDGVDREIIWFALGTEAEALGTVEVDKVWEDPASGQVTLQLGTSSGAADAGSQETGEDGGPPLKLGPVTLAAGTYYVSETPSHPWTSTITGTKNGVDIEFGPDNSFTVANDDVIVITITNAELTPPERPKQWRLYKFSVKTRREERS